MSGGEDTRNHDQKTAEGEGGAGDLVVVEVSVESLWLDSVYLGALSRTSGKIPFSDRTSEISF